MDYLDNKTFKSCKINSLVKGRKKKEKMVSLNTYHHKKLTKLIININR